MGTISMALLGYVTNLAGLIWRHTVKPIFVNWRVRNLERTLSNGDIRIRAHKHEYLPYLTLLCVIKNRSEVSLTVKRVFGSLYVGDWRIGHFDASEVNIKRVDTNRQQYITVSKKSIKKGESTEVEFTFYPPLDFWILGKETCSLGDGGVEVQGGGVKVVIPLGKDDLSIEDIGQVDYKTTFRERLNMILTESGSEKVSGQ
jgi:hypothetical protein